MTLEQCQNPGFNFKGMQPLLKLYMPYKSHWLKESLSNIKMFIFYRVSWEPLCAIECSRSKISFNPLYEFTSTKHKIAVRVIQHDIYGKSVQNIRFFFIATTVKLKYYLFKWRVLHVLISFHNKFLLSVSTCNRNFCLQKRKMREYKF